MLWTRAKSVLLFQRKPTPGDRVIFRRRNLRIVPDRPGQARKARWAKTAGKERERKKKRKKREEEKGIVKEDGTHMNKHKRGRGQGKKGIRERKGGDEI